MIDHKENIEFFLGALCRILNRHKSLEAQETFLNTLWID